MAPETLPSSLQQWAESLQRRGLGEVALWMLDLLRVWGFVGGQLLWMLSPFVDDDRSLRLWAQVLEQPERFRRVRNALLERGVNDG